MHTTNYYNTFIAVAEDCPVTVAQVPPQRGTEKTIANLQFELLEANPYRYTSDQVLFDIHARRQNISTLQQEAEREKFFSKGQACFRASALPKRYGWGVHANEEGKIALVPLGSEEYEKLAGDERLKVVRAMRSKRG
ncbi:DUF6157 family protein [Rufibacter sp. LB8]|uniref:DUF6157 family protein n=1 Tax=Rufibacter sp. LB8 TaxID=2777781 RepID=UPI00178C4D2A|nr:DUF6157 family protein [Rufibacter sp. LB8]